MRCIVVQNISISFQLILRVEGWATLHLPHRADQHQHLLEERVTVLSALVVLHASCLVESLDLVCGEVVVEGVGW